MAVKLYGPVNGLSKEVKKLYGPVEMQILSGVNGTVRSGAVNVTGFNGVTFWNEAQSEIDTSKTPSYLRVQVNASGSKASLDIYYSDETHASLYPYIPAHFAQYGISFSLSDAGVDYIDLTPIYSTEVRTKEITKLYASVNGQSKLIYKEE